MLHAYVPYDLPDAVARFLKRTHPAMVVVMETELWPNLFAACKKQNIPIMITNARLSEKSARGYRLIAPLTREIMAAIDLLAAQGQADADRFIQLGLPKEKIKMTGNLKFDLQLPADLAEKKTLLRAQLGNERIIWLAASTHETEEDIILAAHRRIQEKIPQALLVLVPRHPERFNAVAMLAEQKNFRVARRSRNDVCSKETDVYLGDTMGELLLLYAGSDVAFVGGFVSLAVIIC